MSGDGRALAMARPTFEQALVPGICNGIVERCIHPRSPGLRRVFDTHAASMGHVVGPA